MARTVTAEQWSELVRAGTAQPAPVARDLMAEPMEVEEAEEQSARLRDITMSTANPDRARDTIDLAGWRLENFTKAQGPLLWCHDYGEPPIGTVHGAAVEPGRRLFAAESRFTPEDLNPFGAMIGRLYGKGFCRGLSIGMMPLKYAWNEERGGVDFLEQELLELSCCGVPMNADCLTGAKSAGIAVDLFLPYAEKRLDGDTKAPAWLLTREASLIHRTLSAPRVQVPAAFPGTDLQEQIRRSVAEAVSPLKAQAEALAREVQQLRAPPPPAAPPRPAITQEQLVQAVVEAVHRKFTEVTGLLPE